jgi:steroid delta-isomerase-like uncharacterized protein
MTSREEDSMAREEIIRLFDRRVDAMNRRDVAALTELYSADCVVESPMAAGMVRGHTGVEVYRAIFDAFPDLTFTMDDLLIDDQSAAQSGTIVGTDRGGFMGMPPSGRSMRVPVVILCRFGSSKIVHERRIYDFTGMLLQVGVLKAKPA